MPGTVAGLDCSPDADVVHAMSYYLLEYEDAVAAFDARMAEAGETQRGNCREGEPGVELDFAYFFRGCFRSGGRAHIRYVQAATDCTFGQSHLKAGDVTLRQPALYIAVVGKGNDIERLDRWESGGLAVPLRGQASRLGCGGA